MRVLLLSDAHSIHTIKWAKSLSELGIEIGIFSLNRLSDNPYNGYKRITVFYFQDDNCHNRSSSFKKLSYLKSIGYVKRIIKDFKPDIVHAHYASSYGLVGALTGFHPYIISVWGSDVYDFPNVSLLHKEVLKYNLKKADRILSTSHVMAKETKKYTDKDVYVTPFGIDLNVFKPMKVKSLFGENDIVIGTIKTLEEKYGIEYLIRAFELVKRRNPNLHLKLLIVGGGSLDAYLKELTQKLGIASDTIFTGKIPHEMVPVYDNMLSVSVSVSNSESFGVAVIEASACGIPVVVSNVGGLPEVVENQITGMIVPPRNPKITAEAIECFVLDPVLRKKVGKAGRTRVKRLYDWNSNVREMLKIYRSIIQGDGTDDYL